MEGVLQATRSASETLGAAKGLLEEYRRSFAKGFIHFVRLDGTIDWFGILHHING